MPLDSQALLGAEASLRFTGSCPSVHPLPLDLSLPPLTRSRCTRRCLIRHCCLACTAYLPLCTYQRRELYLWALEFLARIHLDGNYLKCGSL